MCLGKICTKSVVIWWKFHFLLRQHIQELFFVSLILQEWTPNNHDFVLIFNFFVLFLCFQVTLRFLLSIYLVSLLKWQNLSLFLFLHNSFFLLLHFLKVLFVIQFVKLTFHLPFITKYWLYPPIACLTPVVYSSHSQLLLLLYCPSPLTGKH